MKSSSKYDLLLIFYITLLAFGEIGASLQPARIFIICLTPFMLVYFIKNPKYRRMYSYEVLFFGFWWIYACVSVFKAVSMDESLKHIVYMFVHFSGFFVVIWLAMKSQNPQRSIIKGWILMFALTVPIALYEFWFDIHLPMSYQESNSYMKFGKDVVDRQFASVTFCNLNNYNTILGYVAVFLTLWLLKAVKTKDKVVGWIIFGLLVYVVLSNSSRGALLYLVMSCCLYVLFRIRKNKKYVIIFCVILVFLILMSGVFIEMFPLIFERFSDQGLEDIGRVENIQQGLLALWNSNLLGIGVGNYAPIMENVYRVMIPAPHNLFLEILVLFGVIVFLGFLWMLVRILNLGLKGSIHNREAAVIGLVLLPVIGIIDSGYLLNVSMWLFLASLYVCADSRYNNVSLSE
jgi:teichuronic acid biosynthesis protein TuaE